MGFDGGGTRRGSPPLPRNTAIKLNDGNKGTGANVLRLFTTNRTPTPMRETSTRQLPLRPEQTHRHQRDLANADLALSALPEEVLLRVDRDLRLGRRADVGRTGMSAERVIRVIVLRMMTGMSYERLAFAIDDSLTYRAFIRLGPGEPAPHRSTLHQNAKRVSASSLELVNISLIGQAVRRDVERGDRVAVDATGVETNIHHPNDSSLLGDCVTKSVPLLKMASRQVSFHWVDHRRRAKRYTFAISNAKSMRRREPLYRELLKVVAKVGGYLRNAIAALRSMDGKGELQAIRIRARMEYVLELLGKVVEQTFRRVMLGERVSPQEKVLSIHEPHTDIIKKGAGDPLYGHKVFVAMGRSGLVLDLMTPRGNPNDAQVTLTAVERVASCTGSVPSELAFDGGFASQANHAALKGMGVDAIAFGSPRGLRPEVMSSSKKLFRTLMRFRASIEGAIGWLKNSFGLRRCKDSGFASFSAYAWAAAITHNLVVLGRSP